MRIRILGAAGAVALSLTLAGCASPIESIIEPQTDAEITTDGEGGLMVETDTGSVQAGSSVELPADFPADHPVPAGRLVSAWASEGSWLLVFEDVALSEYERMLAHYTSSRYEEILRTASSNINDHQMAVYESTHWNVSVSWEDVRGGNLNYNVAAR
ncbi:MAG: hypothetical protein KF680_02200 [Cryobacterium sp.]|nr:hypothetical protein [Cryobacterium sp.]